MRVNKLIILYMLVAILQVIACGNGESEKVKGQHEVQPEDQGYLVDSCFHDGQVVDIIVEMREDVTEEGDNIVETAIEVLEVFSDIDVDETHIETIMEINDIIMACDEEAWLSDPHAEWYQPNPLEAGPAPYDENCIPEIDKKCSNVCDCKWVRVVGGCIVVGARIDVPWSFWEFLGKDESLDKCVLELSCGVAVNPEAHTLMCKNGQCYMEGDYGDAGYQVLVYDAMNNEN